MQNSIGEIIRQVRRQRNLTQSELGGNHYSKSYVSAVERNKILSSKDALRFFAEQLGQSSDYFILLLDPSGQAAPSGELVSQHGAAAQDVSLQLSHDDTITLLDMLLENTDLSQLTIHQDLPSLSPDIITALPGHKQFRFYYLMGLVAREKGVLPAALNAFEYALVLAPSDQQPVILDEIGLCYASTNDHHTALVYFQRALPLLQDDMHVIRFKLELHCADSYRASGINERAVEFYELALQHQPADSGIRTAGLLYLGLGYCTYAAIQRKLALDNAAENPPALDDIERSYQRAVGYLIQSRSVFQVTNDCSGETQVRLTLAFILLDFSEQRRNAALPKAQSTGKPASMNCAALLDDAEDQCHQVLLSWQEARGATEAEQKHCHSVVSSACAGLIHCALQRAMLARIAGYAETSTRELALASYLCQQMFDMFKEHAQLWNIIRNIIGTTLDSLDYLSPVLPRLLPLVDYPENNWRDSISLVEVYFALGATCEELGRAASTLDYTSDCYMRSTRYFHAMLEQAQRVVYTSQIDLSYLTRCYSNCVTLLEDRARTSPHFSEEARATLLDILKDSLWMYSQRPL
ncbi:MAG: hypothetical protein ABI406_12915 [Ktedonobacteraceae bacterium]